MVAIMLDSCTKEEKFPGYRLVEKKFVKEVNAECYLLEHEKSGARVLKILSDDQNKTFSISFNTIPDSDAGTPHILEHSVLNGSKNFPVKSPFDVLMKGSLNTFINALTSNDWTAYPVASMNEKDYFNLMHVYLDAVFNPRIYDEPRIFMQEGWHHEMTSADGPVEYKGVVYNEMKGAYSDPERILYDKVLKSLFPETCYRFSSGGIPTEITKLTYEKFLDFHRKFYHPSNSYIFLYGNADLARELEFIDREYLSHYDRINVESELKNNTPFTEGREDSGFYPVIEGSPVNDQTYLSLNYIIGAGSDDLTGMAIDILAEVLVNQESAPLRIALREAGIGKEVSAYRDKLYQNVMTIYVKNANPEDKDRFMDVVTSTLTKVSDEKIDREALKGTVNRLEFSLREGNDAQKGIMYNLRCLNSWIYTGSPFSALEYETYLGQIKEAMEGTFFEDFIRSNMIDNQNRALVVLAPKPGLENENMKLVTAELENFKKGLSQEESDSLINATNSLIAFQQTEDTPEALATIPMLSISDINPKATVYECTEENISGVKHLTHSEFTNNVIYTTQWFDLRVLPQEMLPYASVLSYLMGKLNTTKYDFMTLDKALNINTGGFSTGIGMRLYEDNDDMVAPLLTVRMKTTADKIDTSLMLTAEILRNTLLTDRTRIRDLLARSQANLEISLTQDGLNTGRRRFESYLSKRGLLIEQTGNIEYYRFLTALLAEFDKNPDVVISKLQETAGLIFNRGNMTAAVTCDESDFGKYSPSFSSFAALFPETNPGLKTWQLDPVPANEGIMTSSKVQYVFKGYDFKKLGMEWNGKWNVLSQILSTEWLQTRIRVIGGAYGGWTSMYDYGTVVFTSYRDPNLTGTLENYDKTTEFLGAFNADSSAMTRFIIGTIAGLDNLTTPSQRGDIAFSNYFRNITAADLQKERDEVLTTTAADIRDMAGFINEVLSKDVICVFGNNDIIKSNGSIFGKLITLEK